MEHPWYSFLLESESTPGPYCCRKFTPRKIPILFIIERIYCSKDTNTGLRQATMLQWFFPQAIVLCLPPIPYSGTHFPQGWVTPFLALTLWDIVCQKQNTDFRLSVTLLYINSPRCSSEIATRFVCLSVVPVAKLILSVNCFFRLTVLRVSLTGKKNVLNRLCRAPQFHDFSCGLHSNVNELQHFLYFCSRATCRNNATLFL